MPQATIPSEDSIVRSIIRRLEREPAVWLIKAHGSGMGRTGVPDILGCHMGRMFALEVKRPRVGVVSDKQRYELRRIANAGGICAVVESVEDVCELMGLEG